MKQTVLILLAYLVLSLGQSQAQDQPKHSLGKVPVKSVKTLQNQPKMTKAEMLEYKRKVHADNLAKRQKKQGTNTFVPRTERGAIAKQQQQQITREIKVKIDQYFMDMRKNNPEEYKRIQNLSKEKRQNLFKEVYQKLLDELEQSKK